MSVTMSAKWSFSVKITPIMVVLALESRVFVRCPGYNHKTGDLVITMSLASVGDTVSCLSGRRMQRFLQFRLAPHNLPIVAGRLSGDHHVARIDRVCTHCSGIAVADELHMIHECPVLQPLRLQYAALFTPDTNTMRSFFAQQDHMQVFKFVLDCLDFLKL